MEIRTNLNLLGNQLQNEVEAQTIVSVTSSVTLALASADKLHFVSGAAAITVTLPAVSGFVGTLPFKVSESFTGSLALYTSDSTIEGLQTQPFYLGESFSLFVHNNAWHVTGIKARNFLESNFTYGGKTGVKLLATNAATNVDVVIQPKGTGGFSLQQPDGTAAGGNAIGARAVNLSLLRNSPTQAPSGDQAFQTGSFNTTSGFVAATFGGSTNTASGSYAICVAGFSCVASSVASVSLGVYTVSARYAGIAKGSFKFSTNGDCQKNEITLGIQATSTTPVILTCNGSAADSTNQLILENYQSLGFTGLVTAKKQGGATSTWAIEGQLSRGANAASTTLDAQAVRPIVNTAGYTLELLVDTTNGGLKVQCTAEANVRIGGFINAFEITYP